jgi:restriction system protein
MEVAMAKYTLLSFVRDVDRMSRSVQYQRRVAENRQRREYERAIAAHARDQRAADKATRQQYVSERMAAVQEFNNAIAARVGELNAVLRHTLSVDDNINFDSLLTAADYPPFQPPANLAKPGDAPIHNSAEAPIKPLNFIERAFKSKRVEKATQNQAEVQARYDAEYNKLLTAYQTAEKSRQEHLTQLRAEYEHDRKAFMREVVSKNAEIEEFKAAYLAGEKDAIEAYNTLVLDRSEYPDDFPSEHEVQYDKASATVSVSKQVPSVTIIPKFASCNYVKSSDSISEKPRTKTDLKSIHTAILCQIALRTIHELFEADQKDWIRTIDFSGYLVAVDPARGGTWKPTVIRLSMTKDQLLSIKLHQIEPTLCAKEFGAKMAKALDGTVSLKG